jgi:hypothetical protein
MLGVLDSFIPLSPQSVDFSAGLSTDYSIIGVFRLFTIVKRIPIEDSKVRNWMNYDFFDDVLLHLGLSLIFRESDDCMYFDVLPIKNILFQAMHDESPYLQALVDINSPSFSEKEWLVNNFDLYKRTLNWPDNLPPIRRSNLQKGMLIEKFNTTYHEILSEFDYELDNGNQILILRDRLEDD